MKISELINKLQEFEKDFGDIEVGYESTDIRGCLCAEDIDVKFFDEEYDDLQLGNTFIVIS